MSSQPVQSFSDLKSVHIVGVCGTLMGAFASFLKRKGIEVSGSDQNIYPPMSDVLQEAGVKLYSGYRSENIGSPDLIVIGNVIRKDNPEAVAAIQGGKAYCSLPEFMERLLLSNTRNILASGTHGKTTTASLLTHTLRANDLDPNWFIGGVTQDLPFSFHVSQLEKGHPFVLEGDEYDTAFWDKVPKFNHYLPDDVILTSVEYDHADIYPSEEACFAAFEGLIPRIRTGGRLIACTDYPHLLPMIHLAEQNKIEVYTYGLGSEARYQPRILREGEAGIEIEIRENGPQGLSTQGTLQIPLNGNHNALNATAVWIEARMLGLSHEQIRAALQTFQGVKRRQEVRGVVDGVRVIDDFAHHPTAVLETLKGLKKRYSTGRLVAVFEPRSATSRRAVFQKRYAEAFEAADQVIIAKPFLQEGIDPADRLSSERLVGDLQKAGIQAREMDSVDSEVQVLSRELQSGDTVAILSNGGFEGFIPKLMDQLKKR